MTGAGREIVWIIEVCIGINGLFGTQGLTTTGCSERMSDSWSSNPRCSS